MKKITVSLEHRFYRCGDKVYTKLAFPYGYWRQYLRYFDAVNVVARVESVSKVDSTMVRADGGSVVFLDVPYYVGPKAFFFKLPQLLKATFLYVKSNKHFLLRSGNVSNLMFLFIFVFRRPYLREFPGDIKKGVAGYSGKSPLILFLAWALDSFARFQARCSKANSFVSYATKSLYQSSRPSFVFSSFDLSEIEIRKKDYSLSDVFKIVSLGRLENEKGHMDLLKAIKIINGKGVKVALTLIGDGSASSQLRDFSKGNQVECEFLGAVTDRNYIFTTLVDSDLFVLPSHTEGMPRALLEAMALGLPCIGTNVGGVPEVLEEECMVDPESPIELSKLILLFSGDKILRQNAGLRNANFIQKKYSLESSKNMQTNFWSKVYE